MTKEHIKVFQLAGFTVALAVIRASAAALANHEPNAPAAASKSAVHPEADSFKIFDIKIAGTISLTLIQVILTLLCIYFAFALNWKKSWQLYALVVVLIASLLFTTVRL